MRDGRGRLQGTGETWQRAGCLGKHGASPDPQSLTPPLLLPHRTGHTPQPCPQGQIDSQGPSL